MVNQTDLLASVSHELRSPLNGIIGFAELMHDGRVGPVAPAHKEFLGDILASARHLLQLIDTLLHLCQAEPEKLESRPVAVDLDKCVCEIRALLRSQAVRKQVRIDVRINPAVGSVVVDPARLKQILYSYLANALQGTPEGGQVTIRIDPEGADAFVLEVADPGSLRSEDPSSLFVESPEPEAGVGRNGAWPILGLPRAKRLVEAQGGRVGVRATPGEGRVLFAVLPRVARAAPDPATAP